MIIYDACILHIKSKHNTLTHSFIHSLTLRWRGGGNEGEDVLGASILSYGV